MPPFLKLFENDTIRLFEMIMIIHFTDFEQADAYWNLTKDNEYLQNLNQPLGSLNLSFIHLS